MRLFRQRLLKARHLRPGILKLRMIDELIFEEVLSPAPLGGNSVVPASRNSVRRESTASDREPGRPRRLLPSP